MSEPRKQYATEAVFFERKESKDGKVYFQKDIGDSVYRIALTAEDEAVVSDVTNPDTAKQILKPKTNQYGNYYVGEIAGKRYFISKRTNKRGEYVMAKEAPERTESGAQVDRPKTYGAPKA